MFGLFECHASMVIRVCCSFIGIPDDFHISVVCTKRCTVKFFCKPLYFSEIVFGLDAVATGSNRGKPVTVKHPDSDIPAGTLNSIKKQADWK